MGAIPPTKASILKIFNVCVLSNRLFTIARAITTPPLLPKACKNRKSQINSMSLMNRQASDERIKRQREIRIGFLLPYRSAIGPQNNCPKASPPKKVDSEICTLLTGVFKSLAICGKLGKYMSILKGPNAVRLAKVNTNIHSCLVRFFNRGKK